MSSDDIAIRVSNLSKRYEIYNKPGDRLKQFIIPKLCRILPVLKRLFATRVDNQGNPVFFNEFWALKDVSFEIKKGETVGIIGRNGSGKSTLLQLICGTLNPTAGEIKVNGRIAALLELGAGFNPEFTGRENVRMSCALLGMTAEETEAHFDEIAAFADIGEFIELPVKTYSSGMFVRLAFAVNIVSKPDIMIIDEALAVGDMNFQARCMTALAALKNKGVTLLFVSHDIGAVSSLCEKAIYLSSGKLVAMDNSLIISQLYQHHIRKEIAEDQIIHNEEKNDTSASKTISSYNGTRTRFRRSTEFDRQTALYRDGLGYARVTYAELINNDGERLDCVKFDQEVEIVIHFESYKKITISPGYYILDKYGNRLLGAVWVGVPGKSGIETKSGDQVVVSFKTRLPLAEGLYRIVIELIEPVRAQGAPRLDDISDAVVFRVLPRDNMKSWSNVYIHNTLELLEISNRGSDEISFQ